MLFEWVELEVYKIAADFGQHRLTITQFKQSLFDISEKCSTVLTCLRLVEHLSPFEQMILQSITSIKASTEKVYKNFSGPDS